MTSGSNMERNSRIVDWPFHTEIDNDLWARASPDLEMSSSSSSAEKDKGPIVIESEAVVDAPDGGALQVVGSTTLYVNGRLKLIPVCGFSHSLQPTVLPLMHQD